MDDTGDLYEGGRFKRKRSDLDDGDSDESSWSKKDNSEENVPYAKKLTTKLIRAEFNKRKVTAETSTSSDRNEITLEEREVADNSPILDPFNRKINNLGAKSRDNWFRKMVQSLEENLKVFPNPDEDKESLCVTMEHESFSNAKNLIIYQSNCMKKISEIKKFTKDNKSFGDEYKRRAIEMAENEKKEENLPKPEDEEENECGNNKKPSLSVCSSSFTSALKIYTSNEAASRLEQDVQEKVIEEKVVSNRNTTSPGKPPADSLDIKQISAIVVAELNVYYKKGLFLNKDLFKSLAKKLAQYVLYRNFCNEKFVSSEIRTKLAKLNNKKITDEKDFEFIFDN
jgi:hypothetical protein